MKSRLRVLKEIIEKETQCHIDRRRGKTNVTFARAVFCKVARDMCQGDRRFSYAAIGDVIGKTHATVMHNINVIFPFSQKEQFYKNLYETSLELMIDVKDTGNHAKRNFSLVKRLSDKIKELEDDNFLLKHEIIMLKRDRKNFNALFDGLCEYDIEEVHNKLSLFVKAIKNRVYN